MRGLLLVSCLAVCLSAALARAQGDVMSVGVANGKLVVGNGVVDNLGFADRMFVEVDADGFPLESSVSGFGPAYLWTVPGLHISDMATNSGLFIEALARPVKDASPAKDRVLWYWNSTTGTIEDAPPDNHFVIYKLFASLGIFLEGTTSETPEAIKIADPLWSDLGVDNYGGLVRFALHRESPPPAGVYAVFARFTSNQYQPSDPFLLTFNNGQISGSQMMTGALAINAAAVGPVMQDGDFNLDGKVDAADYTVWRNNGLGSDQYALWKSNFGIANGAGGLADESSIAVPEPGCCTLAACGLIGLLWQLSAKRARQFDGHSRRRAAIKFDTPRRSI
jgi:hypothetical protein